MTVLSDETLLEIWHSNQCTSDDLPLLRAVADAAVAADRAGSGKPVLKIKNGEVCYLSDADDQSYGMWCPVTPDYTPPLKNGTKLYTHPHHTEDNLEMVLPQEKAYPTIAPIEYELGYVDGWNACRAALLATQKEPTT